MNERPEREPAEGDPRANGAPDLPMDVGVVAARGGRRAERALALIALGAFLFLPATISVAVKPAFVAGLPLIWVYLFGSWLLLILGAAALSVSPGSAGVPDASERPVPPEGGGTA